MTPSRRILLEMLGDFLSEVAVLVAVFVLLEGAVNRTLTGGTVLFTVVVMGVAFAGATWIRITLSSSTS